MVITSDVMGSGVPIGCALLLVDAWSDAFADVPATEPPTSPTDAPIANGATDMARVALPDVTRACAALPLTFKLALDAAMLGE